ncbi:hypothetical protein NDU88_002098 [Pleurodeles waltl]|uniref:Uncharacterized protein n=1 Tax=Pleurodeles waltl TaxID=8319 RepID=A0AAV7Q663_PLEWA|nr:hypothetical protein NDU88_002098 [Pleurodeles waltl]
MNAIQGLRSALEQQIETVSIDLNLLRADLRKVSEKVNTAETTIGSLQGGMTSLKKQMTAVRTEVDELGRRAEDEEAGSRRSSIWVLGFPDKSEGTAMERFLEGWIRDETPRPLRVFCH